MKLGLVMLSQIVFATTALAQVHPDETRYEYAVKGSVGTYPDERERVNWECFDSRSKMSIACSFVRGALIEKYDYVYKRKSTSAPSGGFILRAPFRQ
jgi:hypothetical protein